MQDPIRTGSSIRSFLEKVSITRKNTRYFFTFRKPQQKFGENMHNYASAFTKTLYDQKISIVSLLLLLLFNTVEGIAQFPAPAQDEEEKITEPEWPQDSFGRRTPRGTISGFIAAVGDNDYEKASNYLNMAQASVQETGPELAQILENFLNRRGQINPYSWISAETHGRTDDDLPPDLDKVGSFSIEGENIDLYLEETKGPEGGPVWLISSATIETIDSLSDVVVSELFVERLLPPVLEDNEWGGVAIGHWLVMLFLAVLVYLLFWILIKAILFVLPRLFPKAGKEPTSGIIRAFALPVQLYLTVWLFVLVSQEIGISIVVRQKFSGLTVIVGILAILILLWRLAEFIGKFSTEKMHLRGNVSGLSITLFLQRLAKFAIIVFGVIAVLNAVGVDVTTGLAALGIGGLALALGAQKTIENFVGSVTVITDQPVRVGDFCKVGDTVGTVEKIGMRSTRIRTLGRTIVTIPNGKFSSENIENYAKRDRFWFSTVLGLRYETSAEQLRFLLVELRSALYAHPMVSPDPARVRFINLGADSLQLEVFAYIVVATYDEYLEVKEDLLLRMMDIVEESGSGFAFPSQTIYFGRDTGLSSEKTKKAEEKVKQWREKGELQIPQFDPQTIEELKGKTPYPPPGSTKRKDEGTGEIPGL